MNALMPTPRSVDLEITGRCNARCRYCYYLGNPAASSGDLPASRWLSFFDELGEARVLSVCFAGGEPLLRPDFFDLVEGVMQNRMRFTILTNGLLLDRETARRLSGTGRLDSIQVSLDGSTPSAHEAMRGAGTFGPVLAALRLLCEEGLPVTVRTTVHPRNVENLPDLARLLLEELGLSSFSTNAVSPLVDRSKYPDDIFLSPVERFRAMRILDSLERRYPGRIRADAGPQAEWRNYRLMEDARRSGRALPGRGRLTGCGCVFRSLAVRADGCFIPCLMLPGIVLGRIGDDRLEAVWRRAPLLVKLRERRLLRLDAFPLCRGCGYAELCTGNCPGTASSLSGDPNSPSPEGCLRIFNRALRGEGISPWKS